MAEYFLPALNKTVLINEEIEVRLFEGEEIARLYSDDRFHMALAYDNQSDRRDVLTMVGYVDGKITGIAGASNDCETMWHLKLMLSDVIIRLHGLK